MNLQDDLAALADRYQSITALLAHPDLHTLRPERSGWSAAGHLWHTEASATSVLMAIARIVGGRGEAAEPDPQAIAVLAQGVFPPGRQAPEGVRPPADGVDGEALAAKLARNAAAFARLEPAALGTVPTTLPHPALGPLTAPLWVRFARVHAAHHDTIAAGLLGVSPHG
ncbi:MAG TPA: DinB family protein [Rhodothermales bacterium]|nr:DinB family protein [Rhodothermales bacterium]